MSTLGLVLGIIASVLVSVAEPAAAQTASSAADDFVPLAPTRVLDTRIGLGTREGPVRGGDEIVLSLGEALIEAGAPEPRFIGDSVSVVVLNVTSTQATRPSFVTVWSDGADRPEGSSLNTEPGQDTPNMVVVRPTGSDNLVRLFNSAGSTHLVADLVGYYESGLSFSAVDPKRVLDTRIGLGHTGAVAGGETVTFEARSVLSSNFEFIQGLVLNITSTQATRASFVTVWPSERPRPNASTLNTEPGQDTPNMTIVGIANDGRPGEISLYNAAGSTHLIVDVVGYVGGLNEDLQLSSPTRILDTRTGLGAPSSPVAGGGSIDVQVAGTAGVPDDAHTVVVNLTTTRATRPSFITAWPTGEARPNASALNTEPGQDTPNLAFVKLSASGAMSVYNSAGSVDLIADVVGWYVEPDRSPTEFVQDLGVSNGDYFVAPRPTLAITDPYRARWTRIPGVAEVVSGHGPGAIAEQGEAWVQLRGTFQSRSDHAEITYDIDWNGILAGYVGIGGTAEVTVVLRMYELIVSNGNLTYQQTRGRPIGRPIVLANEDLTAVLQGFDQLRVESGPGEGIGSFSVDGLEPGTIYAVEVESRCESRAAFTFGVVQCNFYGGGKGVFVNEWSVRQDLTR